MDYFRNAILSHGNSFDLLLFLAVSAVKATLLLGFVALLCLVCRRFSAATRHLLWTLALCAALLLPFLSVIKAWEVPILPARISVPEVPAAKESSGSEQVFGRRATQSARRLPDSFEASDGVRKRAELQSDSGFLEESLPEPARSVPQPAPQEAWPSLLAQPVNWALLAWAALALLLLCRLLIGLSATNLLARRAAEFKDPALTELFSALVAEVGLKSRVRLLRSERTLMPIVCGILRPAVLLPADAEAWSENQRRMVLLHELTHVARRDCLTQAIAQVACALYWFNPFVWMAARRLRVEREQACDDYVLSIGTKPSDYAHHLLEIARSMQERSVFQWSQTTSVAMARKSQLEGRLLAILSKENRRGAVSRVATTGLAGLIFVLLLSLALVRPTVIGARNSQASNTALNNRKDEMEGPRGGSFTAGSSEHGNGALVQGQEAQQAAGKRENAAGEVSPELALSGGGIDDAVKLYIDPPPEPDVEQDIVVTAPGPVGGFQFGGLPEVPSQVKPTANPQVNVTYQQENSSERQDKSQDYIEEMASVGYANLSIDELIKLKTAGVSADYVRSLRALGIAGLTPKELASMSIQGVAPAYIQAIRAAGYNELSAKELTAFRIHDITPGYIKTLRDAGYANLTAKQLIEFAVHEVTPAFISGIRAAGYSNLSPKELVSLRANGITAEYIRKVRSRLGDLSIKQLISLKNAGLLDEDSDKG
ncbi:MAG TPA: M56 family metallopeptidase [Pyrinomonadaceae bacterium]|jgi:beta-lactamase regulating signal transducer with metallopeptidase domain